MKRMLFLISFCFSLLLHQNSYAQSFTTETDTARASIYDFQDVYNRITNITTNPIQITWKVTAHDFPVSWALDSVLGICDNSACRNNTNNQLFTNTYTSMDYTPNDQGDFHLQLSHFSYPHIVSGQHYMVVNLKNGSNEKNVVFEVTKFPTGISTVNKTERKLVLFPSPANSVLNIVVNQQLNGNIVRIYNSTGMLVKQVNIEEGLSKIDVSGFQSGMYFIKLTGVNSDVIAVDKFMKQ